ncbi:MAG: hypothetical protein LBI69_00005 [Puniceicoccales bacterium]|jgi:hypothetical protein|nr:hypothetical protein [Puniceicoccales bacterium]
MGSLLRFEALLNSPGTLGNGTIYPWAVVTSLTVASCALLGIYAAPVTFGALGIMLALPATPYVTLVLAVIFGFLIGLLISGVIIGMSQKYLPEIAKKMNSKITDAHNPNHKLPLPNPIESERKTNIHSQSQKQEIINDLMDEKLPESPMRPLDDDEKGKFQKNQHTNFSPGSTAEITRNGQLDDEKTDKQENASKNFNGKHQQFRNKPIIVSENIVHEEDSQKQEKINDPVNKKLTESSVNTLNEENGKGGFQKSQHTNSLSGSTPEIAENYQLNKEEEKEKKGKSEESQHTNSSLKLSAKSNSKINDSIPTIVPPISNIKKQKIVSKNISNADRAFVKKFCEELKNNGADLKSINDITIRDLTEITILRKSDHKPITISTQKDYKITSCVLDSLFEYCNEVDKFHFDCDLKFTLCSYPKSAKTVEINSNGMLFKISKSIFYGADAINDLSIFGVNFTEIIEELPSSLTYLRIACTNLKISYGAISKLTNLKFLSLKCLIINMPQTSDKFTFPWENLEHFYIPTKRFGNFVNTLCLQSLKSITLDGEVFETIPQWILMNSSIKNIGFTNLLNVNIEFLKMLIQFKLAIISSENANDICRILTGDRYRKFLNENKINCKHTIKWSNMISIKFTHRKNI